MPVPPPAPPKASSGCFVGAVAVVALLGFGLLATLLSVVDDRPVPPGITGGTGAPPPAVQPKQCGPVATARPKASAASRWRSSCW